MIVASSVFKSFIFLDHAENDQFWNRKVLVVNLWVFRMDMAGELVFCALMLAYCEWQDNPDPINTELGMCRKTSAKIEIHPDACNTQVCAFMIRGGLIGVCVWRAGRRAAASTQGDVGQSAGSMGDEAWGCRLWGGMVCWSNRERPKGRDAGSDWEDEDLTVRWQRVQTKWGL